MALLCARFPQIASDSSLSDENLQDGVNNKSFALICIYLVALRIVLRSLANALETNKAVPNASKLAAISQLNRYAPGLT